MKKTPYYNFMEQSGGYDYEEVYIHPSPPITKDLLNAWPIRKVLNYSDTNPNGKGIVLPKDQVQQHLLPNLTLEQRYIIRAHGFVHFIVRDLDTSTDFSLWFGNPDGTAYTISRNWTLSFLHRRKLRIGQEIGLRCSSDRLLYFSVIG